MNCPICNKPMKKYEWRITSNGKSGSDLKEYDKTKYKCEADDVWVDTEIPVKQQP